MKSTFFAILASAAIVFASPLPEEEADGHSGQSAPYGHSAAPSSDPWGRRAGKGYGGPPPTQWGGGPPSLPNGPAPSIDPSSNGAIGSGSFKATFEGTFQGATHALGYAPAEQWDHPSWPHDGDWPAGSPFGNGQLNNLGSVCSANKQAVACGCGGGSGSGLLGGLLSSCTLNLLDSSCNQDVRCCDTQEQNGLVNIGLQCGDLLDL